MGSIVVQNLGKAYKQYPTRWSRLWEWIDPLNKPRHQLKWILEDINFQVKPGEALGIIGINGAGKSTLLKMITGTTQPTTGSVQLNGRVAALLELGMGFHPEFTGKQNAYMAGQLLGLSVEEITNLMPEIEAFAEIGEYINQPVRVYSSGMMVRLAFSVATAVRPDILIVDEALSVGDAYFQHKSFARIKEFREFGTTLLIVSHDSTAIKSVCDKAILINSGQLGFQGAPEEVFDYYNALLSDKENQSIQQISLNDGKTQTISGTGEVVISSIKLLNEENCEINNIYVGQLVKLKVVVKIIESVPELVLGLLIKDRLGNSVFGTNSYYLNKILKSLEKGQTIKYEFVLNANLGPGSYSISLAVHSSNSHIENNYEWIDLAVLFNVINYQLPHFIGNCWLPIHLETI